MIYIWEDNTGIIVISADSKEEAIATFVKIYEPDYRKLKKPLYRRDPEGLEKAVSEQMATSRKALETMPVRVIELSDTFCIYKRIDQE